MKKHIFKSKVLHNKKEFNIGELCPDEMHAQMAALDVLEEIKEPKAPASPKSLAEEPKAKK